MKKITIILFYFALSNILLAQTDAICIYKVSLNKNTLNVSTSDNKIQKDVKKMLVNAINLTERFEYVLEFNVNESIFYLKNVLIEDNKSKLLPLAKIIVGKGTYYQNKVKNENIHQVKISGGLFLITDSFLTDWEITQDQKMIGKYLCFRAIKQCKSCNTAEEVWFTPEIAVPFGPLGYSGLPGLILEIKKKTITLRLASIDFKPKNIVIKKPTKGKVVTKDEYKKITDGFRSQMKQY